MQNLKNFFELLSAFDPAEDHVLDRCHNVFLIGALLSKKPRKVLELGIGTGYLTISMIYALRYNEVGDLTCVDDLSFWEGAEPAGVDKIRASGVNVLAPVKISDFLASCPADAFDFVVADGFKVCDDLVLNHLNRVVAEGAFVFVRNTNRNVEAKLDGAIEDWLKQHGFFWHQFSESSRSDEYCDRGWLFAVFQTPEKANGPRLPDKSAVYASTGSAGDAAISPVTQPDLNDNNTLYLGLVTGRNYGWGVCSHYLIQQLSRKTHCHVLNTEDGSDCDPALEGKLFQALTGVDFFPMFEHARGQENYGYTFFENELTHHSIENARKYDRVLAGSSWCRDRLLERDISNCDVLIQGIDPKLYYPIHTPRNGNDFVIFSGGKFELRKGQDLVLRAVKILQDKYDDIVLVNCWYNIWPESMKWMAHSRYIEFEYRECPWQDLMQSVYQANGLDSSRIRTFELVPNKMQRTLYEQTDLGVFPNRCEGGTNLVMMEYMACGKPVVAANTSGHTDIVSTENALLLNELSAFNIAGPGNKLIARWQEPSLEELVAQIEYAYLHREEIKALGQRAGEDLKAFTWERSALRLLRHLSIDS